MNVSKYVEIRWETNKRIMTCCYLVISYLYVQYIPNPYDVIPALVALFPEAYKVVITPYQEYISIQLIRQLIILSFLFLLLDHFL